MQKIKKDFLQVQEEFRNKVMNYSKVEFIDYSNAEIKKAILNYPLETILVGLEGAIMTLFTPGTGQYPRMLNIKKDNYDIYKNIFNSLGFVWLLLLSFFAIYGLIKMDKNIFYLFIVLIIMYLIIASSGPGSYSRFRIPFMPLIIIFICFGFKKLF